MNRLYLNKSEGARRRVEGVMELEKRIIHNNVMKNFVEAQVNVDEDFNVPDVKPDIERMISRKCTVQINGVRMTDGKAEVRGTLSFAFLYSSKEIASMQGNVDFIENLNMDGVKEDAKTVCDADVEDLVIRMINSRKVNVRAIIKLKLHSEMYEDAELPYECKGSDRLQVRMKSIEYAQLTVNSADTLRVRQNFELPQNKPNIAEIVWEETQICPVAFQMTQEGLRSEILVTFFVIYRSVEGELLWHEAQETVVQSTDVSGSSPDAVCFVSCRQQGSSVQIRPDFDGEDRVFEVEAVCELGISAYDEKKEEIIDDCYIPSKELDIDYSEVTLKQLLTHNNSKCRAQGTIKADAGRFAQICSCSGRMNIQDIAYEGNNVEINGTIDVTVLCLEEGDSKTLASVRGEIAFRHLAEVRGMDEYCRRQKKEPKEALSLRMNAGLERISASLEADGGIEIKAAAALDLIVFGNIRKSVINNMTEKETDEEQYMSLPLITGYIVKEGDDLWSIAKSHHTTIDAIKACNNLSRDKISPKERLILMKTAL